MRETTKMRTVILSQSNNMSNQQTEQFNEQQLEIAEDSLLSNCCSAEIYDDMDICQDCGEHCGAVDKDDKEYDFVINKWELKQ